MVLNVDTLRLLRHQQCLSQEELADECRQRGISISVASVKRAEAGKPVIFRTARGLARFFSVTVERLFP
ncbi:XRE family transcriptional regulator [Permianibacter aggregans]|nr:XRE family transcriptional regulator [Permianibacter aggregans]